MALDKYTRTNFYNKNLINGIIENDLAFNKFRDFVFNRKKTYYEVKSEDVRRPDLISLKLFRRSNYWWIILKLNDISDPFNDLFEGQILEIPNISDIEEFVLKNKQGNTNRL